MGSLLYITTVVRIGEVPKDFAPILPKEDKAADVSKI